MKRFNVTPDGHQYEVVDFVTKESYGPFNTKLSAQYQADHLNRVEDNMKHSKGPWTFDIEMSTISETRKAASIYNSKGNLICNVYKSGYINNLTDDEQLANTRLMGLAPELYTKLTEFINVLEKAEINAAGINVDLEKTLDEAKELFRHINNVNKPTLDRTTAKIGETVTINSNYSGGVLKRGKQYVVEGFNSIGMDAGCSFKLDGQSVAEGEVYMTLDYIVTIYDQATGQPEKYYVGAYETNECKPIEVINE